MALIVILGGYLIGSIPFGIIVSKGMGLGDIRKSGSGNIGTTNVLRVGGWKAGLLTLLLDGSKGFFYILVLLPVFLDITPIFVVSFAVVLGHCFPIWLRFKGGKGVATGFGVLLAIMPLVGLLLMGLWVIVFLIWRYSSLSALVAYAFLPIFVVWIEGQVSLFSMALSALLLWTHRENIYRLYQGTELKIGKHKT